jgi:hypothetical protein
MFEQKLKPYERKMLIDHMKLIPNLILVDCREDGDDLYDFRCQVLSKSHNPSNNGYYFGVYFDIDVFGVINFNGNPLIESILMKTLLSWGKWSIQSGSVGFACTLVKKYNFNIEIFGDVIETDERYEDYYTNGKIYNYPY